MTTKRIRNANNANGAIEILDDGTVQFSDKNNINVKTTVDSMKQGTQDVASGKPSYYFNGNAAYIDIAASALLKIGVSDATFITVASSKTLNPTDNNVMWGLSGTGLIVSAQRPSSSNMSVYHNGSYADTGLAIPGINKPFAFAFSRSNNQITPYMNGIAGIPYNSTVTDVSTNALLEFGNTSTNCWEGNIYRHLMFNYALDAAKIARYSAGAKLDFEDIGGSMTDINSGYTFTNASVWSPFSSATVSDGDTFTTSGAGEGGIYRTCLVIGKKYRVTIALSGATPSGFEIQTRGGTVQTIATTPGTYEFIANNTAIALRMLASQTTNNVTTFTLVQLGAVLDLEPESMTPSVWHDESGNGLDGVVTGASLVNLPHFAMTDYGPAAVQQELQDSRCTASFRFTDGAGLINAGTNPINTTDQPQSCLVTFKPRSVTGATRRLITFGGLGIGTDLTMLMNADGTFSAGKEASAISTTSPVSAGWNTYAVTYDLANVSLYGNGLLTVKTAQTGWAWLAGPLHIGSYNNTANWCDSLISRVVYFNYCISEDRVRRYSAGAKLDWEDVGGSMNNTVITTTVDGFSCDSGITESVVADGGLGRNVYQVLNSSTSKSNCYTSNAVIGKKYRLRFQAKGVGDGIGKVFSEYTAIQSLTAITNPALTSGWQSYVLEVTAKASSGIALWVTCATSGGFQVDSFYYDQLGAVLDLEPEGIVSGTTPLWVDSSGNGLNGAVTGALPTNVQKEVLTANSAGDVVFSSATAANLTSISLSPGVWQLTGTAGIINASSISATGFVATLTSTSTPGCGNYTSYNTTMILQTLNTTSNQLIFPIHPVIVTVTATTTWYLHGQIYSYTSGTAAARGKITAIRIA